MGVVEAARGRRVWPWTLNIDGKGLWFDDRASALVHLTRAVKDGRRNVDVGCVQINLRWVGRHLTPAAALNPKINADTAARHLADLRRKFGTWTAAVSKYHSWRRQRGHAYTCKVFVPFTAYREGAARRHPDC